MRASTLLTVAVMTAGCGAGENTTPTPVGSDAATTSDGAVDSGDASAAEAGQDAPAETSTDAPTADASMQPTTTWVRSFGAEGLEDLAGVAMSSGGDVLLAGTTASFGATGTDLWMVRLDGDGNPKVQQRYGGDKAEGAGAIRTTSDGGSVVVGYTESIGAGERDFLVLRFEAQGALAWQRVLGGPATEWANAVVETSDGGFVVAGYTESFGAGGRDAWVVRVDASGEVMWQQAIGGSDMDSANSIVRVADGFVVAGFTKSFGAGLADFWVLRLDDTGGIQWQKTLGGANADYALGLSSAGGDQVAVTGWTASIIAESVTTLWAMVLDGQGASQWQKTIDGADVDQANAMERLDDGTYVLAGTTWSFGAGGKDFWVLRLSGAGEVLWQKTYGGAGWDWAHGVVAAPDGSVVVAGYTTAFAKGELDAWAMRMDRQGHIATDCAAGIGSDSTAQVLDSTLGAVDSTATVTITQAASVDSAFVGQETDAAGMTQCGGS